jgi:hypothetical protein
MDGSAKLCWRRGGGVAGLSVPAIVRCLVRRVFVDLLNQRPRSTVSRLGFGALQSGRGGAGCCSCHDQRLMT